MEQQEYLQRKVAAAKKNAVLATYNGKPDYTPEELNALIVDAMQDIKAKSIRIIDLRKLYDAPTNFFIIASGESTVQARAISDSVYRRVKEEYHTTPSRLEGGLIANWVVMDYFDTVVHVFQKETREFYQLEELWSDGIVTEYEDL